MFKMLYLTRHARRSRGIFRFNELSILPTMTSHPCIRKSAATICMFQKAQWHCIKCGISNSFVVLVLGGYDYKYNDVILHTVRNVSGLFEHAYFCRAFTDAGV